MKRRSMGCDGLPSVSESLAYMCSLLSPFGLHQLSPQNILLAAANHPSASASMWSSLHQLICLQLASSSSSRPVDNVLLSRKKDENASPDDVTGFVKFYLSLWGFSYTSPIFSLSSDTGESRNLLLALAWLISTCDIFKRALKARLEKLSPPSLTLTAVDVCKTSAAVERARQARARSENYVDKLVAASNNLADVGQRARARSQQTLMLYGRLKMSIMALHSSLSTRAKLIHSLNRIQLDLKIKEQEGYSLSLFDLYLLQHKEALEKHFEALGVMKHLGEEMAQCEKHEKTFWQWMVAVFLDQESQRLTERIQQPQKLNELSKFCAVSIDPVVKYLKQHSIDQEHPLRSPSDSTLLGPPAEDQVTSLTQLSLPDAYSEEIRPLFKNIYFRFQGVTFVHETAPTGTLRFTVNLGAESIVERLKLIATALVQALAQIRTRNRICLEDAMKGYDTQDYILNNF